MKHADYAELLTKVIHGTATPLERDAVASYEALHPAKQCPKCKARTRSPFPPHRVVHAVEECDK